MKCYTLSRLGQLVPFIVCKAGQKDPSFPKWFFSVGTEGPDSHQENFPIPQILDCESMDLENWIAEVSEIKLPSGTYLLYIQDQTPIEGFADVKFSHPNTVLVKGLSTHVVGNKRFGGFEYLVSMLPGDYVQIKIFESEKSKEKRFYVYAQPQGLLSVKPYDFPLSHQPVFSDIPERNGKIA